MFNKKPSFFKPLYELRIEDRDITFTYEKSNFGLLGLEYRRRMKAENKINFLHDKVKDIEILPENSSIEKSVKTKAWFYCIKSLGQTMTHLTLSQFFKNL